MEQFTLFCVISAAVIDLTSGVGVLPDIVNASVGGPVTFTTSLDQPIEPPFTTIAWSFESVNVITHSASSNITDEQYRDRITLFTSTGSLELRNLAKSDAGDYSLTIIPVGSGAIYGSTTLKIYEKVSNVKVTATSTDLVEFNDTVTLSCSASGSPDSFAWFNGSSEVTSDRVLFTDGGANVTIDPVLRYDQGEYRCQAFNPVSNDISEPISLFVSYGPEDVNLTAPSDVHAEGSVVPLSCSADSRPGAQFYWLFNGEPLTDTGAQIDLVMKQNGSCICQAYNSRTERYSASQPVEFTVLNKIDNSIVQPATPPVEGSSVNLTCEASGSVPTREWKFNGIELEPSGNIQFYDEKRVLSFTKLTRQDNGKYTCTISNPVSSQSVDYIMKVNYGPENVAITGPTDLKERETLTLSCLADSEPVANYTWIKSGVTVGQSSVYTKPKISSSDGGEYICRATNEITTKSFEASHKVNVTALPPLPRCPPGCIAGIVIGVIAVIFIVAGVTFYMLKKKKQTPKSTSRTDGEGQDNSTYAQNQEVQYADVRFVKKGGQNNPEYAQVRKNNRPQASSLPSYEAHEQRHGRPAPEPSTLYADVRVK